MRKRIIGVVLVLAVAIGLPTTASADVGKCTKGDVCVFVISQEGGGAFTSVTHNTTKVTFSHESLSGTFANNCLHNDTGNVYHCSGRQP